MQELTTGAGLAALGFWLFIGITVAVGVWGSIRRRDAQHETLRRAIESGQPIDENLTDKLLALSGESKDMERDLKVTGSGRRNGNQVRHGDGDEILGPVAVLVLGVDAEPDGAEINGDRARPGEIGAMIR